MTLLRPPRPAASHRGWGSECPSPGLESNMLGPVPLSLWLSSLLFPPLPAPLPAAATPPLLSFSSPKPGWEAGAICPIPTPQTPFMFSIYLGPR